MKKSIHFELLTPQEKLIADDFEMVIVPGSEGDMGVLPGHMPLVSTLRAGMIVAHKGSERLCFFVKEGFVEIMPDHVSVLADKVANLNETLSAALDVQLETTQDEHEKAWITELQKIIRHPPYPLK